jgi:hypothetical protein
MGVRTAEDPRALLFGLDVTIQYLNHAAQIRDHGSDALGFPCWAPIKIFKMACVFRSNAPTGQIRYKPEDRGVRRSSGRKARASLAEWGLMLARLPLRRGAHRVLTGIGQGLHTIVLAFPLHPFLHGPEIRDPTPDLFAIRTDRRPAHRFKRCRPRGLGERLLGQPSRHDRLGGVALNGLCVGHRLFDYREPEARKTKDRLS